MSMIAERTVNLSVEDAAREFADRARDFYRYIPGEGWHYNTRTADGWVRIRENGETFPDGDDLTADVGGPSLNRAIQPLYEAVLAAAAPLMTGGVS